MRARLNFETNFRAWWVFEPISLDFIGLLKSMHLPFIKGLGGCYNFGTAKCILAMDPY